MHNPTIINSTLAGLVLRNSLRCCPNGTLNKIFLLHLQSTFNHSSSTCLGSYYLQIRLFIEIKSLAITFL